MEESLEAGDYEVRLMKKEEENKYTKVRKFILKNKNNGI